ncbi:hypothetical protein A2997_00760 [Candidatus Nomurabacteria bacterium RIFCSPLOWO2_01_FULL_36_10b]|uniref:Segregation and condensation protein A n=1 Tax=Candidatus Nomurabacteria bacterium RIFCSPLOWO2_01_FULL_36_10b TaxID=1801766 RepID=A0A1F6WNM8_9BACT|nr:MAG: hypothetical protein A2997_00760 [Candidatus Nomurabacteria bacterium RIFCSPLOWO2_01_FULL_36_10b]
MSEQMVIPQQKYNVHISGFEGPIELLLRLVEDRKMPINDISLASVTDDYITHIRSMSQISHGVITHFIAVAATLILVKARSLVTNFELTKEEEDSIADLENRLALYQVYVHYGVLLRTRIDKGRRLYTRPFKLVMKIVFSPDFRMNVSFISEQMRDILQSPDIPKPLPIARMQTVLRLEDMIDRLIERVREATGCSFSEFIAFSNTSAKSREEKRAYTIVGFLAMLETIRHGLIVVTQDSHFNDMLIKKVKSSKS